MLWKNRDDKQKPVEEEDDLKRREKTRWRRKEEKDGKAYQQDFHHQKDRMKRLSKKSTALRDDRKAYNVKKIVRDYLSLRNREMKEITIKKVGSSK